jgi:ankyrin repeat protein
MGSGDAALLALVRAIVAGDDEATSALLAASPNLALARVEQGATRQAATQSFLVEINHYIYAGDTALHIAAAGYRPQIVRTLVALGADVNAKNRRGAQPLHYASDGVPGSQAWNPKAQAETISCLVDAGADPDVGDKSGVTPLHRAIRTRCAAAVRALLDGGRRRAAPQRQWLHAGAAREVDHRTRRIRVARVTGSADRDRSAPPTPWR